MKINDSDLFFTCSLIELIGRSTKQKRSAVVALLGEKILSHIYSNAGVLHCEPIAKNADAFIEMCNIPEGTFDNVADCKYEVPDYWTIGKVFARLIEDVASGNAIETLQKVYLSPVCDAISNYNSDFFYQPRGFIKEFYLDECKNSPKKRKTPALRFAGFTDAWEQRKFSDLVLIERGGSPRPIDAFITSASDGLNWVKIGDAPSQGKYITKTAEKIRPEGLSKTRQVQPGDLILSNSMSFGRPYIMGIYGCIHDGWLLIRSNNSVFDLTFLCHLLGTAQMLEQYRALAAGSTVNNLNKELVGSAKVTFPTFNEQIKIGQILECIDDLITLHQRKYDKLTKVKKSMLEKMFPQNGSDVPEIRFSGFTDAWEQRKLGGVAQVYDGIHQTPIYQDHGVMFLSVENILTMKSEKFISEEAFKRDYKVFPQKGDILMTRIGDVGTPNVVETIDKLAYYVSLALLKPLQIDSYFLCNSIQSPLFQAGLKERTLTTAIPQKINKEEIGKIVIIFPKATEEQQRIGLFFKSLDRLITLHQRELDRLQKIKKSCLEKMFV